MPNPFTAHPRDVGETYLQHAAFALRYGVKMTLGGLAAIAHAIFPFLFQKTASRITDELSALLAGARARTGKDREPR
jgi:hypothetical protein